MKSRLKNRKKQNIKSNFFLFIQIIEIEILN